MTSSLNRCVPAAWLAPALFAVAFAGGCASHRLDLEDRSIARIDPLSAATTPDAVGNDVVWGGQIIAAADSAGGGAADADTYLVAAAPLDVAMRPARSARTDKLFLVRHDGKALEPGRFITALGRFASLRYYPAVEGAGKSEIAVPVLDLEQYRLWPVATYGPSHNGTWGFAQGYVEHPGNNITPTPDFSIVPGSPAR